MQMWLAMYGPAAVPLVTRSSLPDQQRCRHAEHVACVAPAR